MIYDSVLETVGKTPVVKLNHLAPEGVDIYVKLENRNPMGSVKDRLALAVIEAAEKSGELKAGQTVIEATSGNTGIGLAMVCAAKGYPLVIVMAENFSLERRRLMRFLGAKVVLTPAADKGSGMLAKAEELAAKHGWFLTRQFENEANPEVHSRTTAREILDDFEGRKLDYWVATFGTGGTARGVSRVLKKERPEIKIVLAEPDNVPILASGLPQPAPNGNLIVSHPYFRPHPIQGTAPDFISKITGDAMASGDIDEIMPVGGGDAMHLARALAQKEGIFVGISSGASLAAALKVAEKAPKGSTILCQLCDTGERYLSTPLFEGVPTDMTAEEIDISRSTPMCQFGAAPPPPPKDDKKAAQPAAASPAKLDAEAAAHTAELIGDPDNPVVLFALEWCEFCWSARKLFTAMSIPFKSVDLDSVAYQQNDMGGRMRPVLHRLAGAPTIPQIFIGGEHLGGCTDLFEAHADGRLNAMLDKAGVSFEHNADLDPETLLPNWLGKKAG